MNHDGQLLRGNTPTLILAVLRGGPCHGYGIAREIEQRSGDALRFKEGTLYPALQALEGDGLVTSEWRSEPNGRERRVYTLTPAGLAELERRARAWSVFVAAMARVIGGDEHGRERAAPEGSPDGGLLGTPPSPQPTG